MILNYIVGISDIAKSIGVNSNTVSNWIKRDDDFPLPFLRLSSSPLYYGSDISKYLVKRGYNVPALSKLQGKTGKIVIIGKERIERSYLISKLSNNSNKCDKILNVNGLDKIECNVNTIFIDAIFDEYAEFHSDFYEKYKSEKFDFLRERVKKLINQKIIFSEDYFDREIKDLEDVAKVIKEKSDFIHNTYLNVYLHPSDNLANIMRKAKLRKMEIVDMPCIYEENMNLAISKADLYMIILDDNDNTKKDTIKYVIEKLKPYVASSKIVFLYKGEVSNIEELPEKTEFIRKNMHGYENQFESLKDIIINTRFNVAKNTLLLPTMSSNGVNKIEKYFFNALNPVFEGAFIKSDEAEQLKKQFVEVIESKNSECRKYLYDLLLGIPKHNLLKSQFRQEEYILDKFKRENHDRVKSEDKDRIYDLLHSTYCREVKLLDEYFSQFTIENVPEQWKQIIIQYVYYTLSKSIRMDRGIGIGTHTEDEFPPRTMLVEESICAGEMYNILIGSNKKEYNRNYIDTLKDLGVHSDSWDYVGANYQKGSRNSSAFEGEFSNGLTKLKIIKNYLENTTVYCLEDLILCRYVCGLRKVGIHSILQLADISGDMYEQLMKDTIF